MTDHPDFTAHRHPVQAVACPVCRAGVGAYCRRPSGHRASDFHRQRKAEADAAFIATHGERASIERTASGWHIDPNGFRYEATPEGWQAVIPGCERTHDDKEPRQGRLF